MTHVVLRAVELPVVGTSWEGRGCKTFFVPLHLSYDYPKKTYRDRTQGIFTIVVLAVDPVGM